MIRGMKASAGLAFVLVFGMFTASAARAATPTFIESADGKRVLTLDPPELNNAYRELANSATGKPVLYIQENRIYTDYHGEPILVVDERQIRPSANGLVLATFDDEDVRHGPGTKGKKIMNYHHPDLAPDWKANRLYTVNGPKLTPVELVAVLYTLKPEMFKLTDAESAAQKEEMAKNAAEEEKRAAADQIAGRWDLLNGQGPVEKVGSGSIDFGAKKGDAYPVTFDLTKGGGPTWTGVAAYKELSGDKLVWVAYGTPKTVGLCVYEIKGGSLSGKWYPWYIDGDAKNVGTEELKGPESLDGEFKIVAAKAPHTGASYTGTVAIKPLEIVGASDDTKPYSLTWTIGSAKVQGIGIRTNDFLFVSSGAGADVNVAKFKIENGTFHGDWYKLGSKEMGGTAAMK